MNKFSDIAPEFSFEKEKATAKSFLTTISMGNDV